MRYNAQYISERNDPEMELAIAEDELDRLKDIDSFSSAGRRERALKIKRLSQRIEYLKTLEGKLNG